MEVTKSESEEFPNASLKRTVSAFMGTDFKSESISTELVGQHGGEM